MSTATTDRSGAKYMAVGMTAEELAILDALKFGRAWAVPMPRIAKLIDSTTRQVQSIVTHLILVHGVPIGSTSAAPAGYYLIETEAELDATTANLRNRAMAMLLRIQALNNCTADDLLGQIKLELEGGNG